MTQLKAHVVAMRDALESQARAVWITSDSAQWIVPRGFRAVFAPSLR